MKQEREALRTAACMGASFLTVTAIWSNAFRTQDLVGSYLNQPQLSKACVDSLATSRTLPK